MGLSKLWGKDSTGAHGFVFSHIKTIYYNWAQKKLLSTKLDEMDSDTESRLEKSKALDDYASIMSNQTAGFWPDALAVKEGFTQLNTNLTNIWRKIYPIGSIYMSVNSTNPGTLFGGTWQRIQNQFLLAAGSSYAAGSTGGAATVTLNVNQIPAHTHRVNDSVWMNVGGNKNIYFNPDSPGTYFINDVANGGRSSTGWTTYTAGGSQAHNNMPPYLAVYVWKRTA